MTFSTDDNTPQEPVKQPTAPAPTTFKDDEQVSLEQFQEAARAKYGIPKNLMKAMLQQESQGGKDLTSPTGVSGPWQVTEAVAKQYGLDRNDPFHNVAAGARYLKEQYDALGDIKDENERWLGAVGRYYGGPSAVQGGIADRVSRDGVSNPVEHLERVSRNWRALGLDGKPTELPTPEPQAPPEDKTIYLPTDIQQASQASTDDVDNTVRDILKKPRAAVSPFQKDVQLAKRPRSGTVMHGVDPTRQDTRIALNAGEIFSAKDILSNIKAQTAQQFGVRPSDYDKLIELGILDQTPYDQSQIASIRNSAQYYASVAGDKKLYLPVSEAQKNILTAFKRGGFDAAMAMRGEMDRQSSAYVNSSREITPQEVQESQAAQSRIARDSAFGQNTAAEADLARGILNAAGAGDTEVANFLKNFSGNINSQIQQAPGKESLTLSERGQQALIRFLSPGTARLVLSSLAGPAAPAVMGAQGFLEKPDAPFDERMKHATTMAALPLVTGSAAPALETIQNPLLKAGAQAAMSGTTMAANTAIENPGADALDLTESFLSGAAFHAKDITRAASATGVHPKALLEHIQRSVSDPVPSAKAEFERLDPQTRAELEQSIASGDLEHPIVPRLVWMKTLDQAEREGINANAVVQALDAHDQISQRRMAMGGLPVAIDPAMQAQYTRVMELQALNNAQLMLEGMPSLGIAPTPKPTIVQRLLGGTPQPKPTEFDSTAVVPYTDSNVMALESVAPDFPVDFRNAGATLEIGMAKDLANRLASSGDREAQSMGQILAERTQAAERQGYNKVGLFNVEGQDAGYTAAHERLHTRQEKLVEQKVRETAKQEADRTLSDIELSERIARTSGEQRANSIQESMASRVGNVRYVAKEPPKTVNIQGDNLQQDRAIYNTDVRDQTLGNLLGGGRHASELQSRFRRGMEQEGYFQDPQTQDIEQVYEPLAKLADREFLRRNNISTQEAEALVISELRALNVDSEAVRSLADHLPASQRRAFLEFLDNRGTDKYKGTANETKATAKVKSNPPSEAPANPAPTGRVSDEKSLPVNLAPKDGAGEAGRPAPTETGARNEPTSQERTPTAELEAQRASTAEPRTEPEQRKPGKQEGTVTFKTSKGSLYESHEDGTTTRNKSYHPEHGEKDQGIQPRSEQTFYVDREGLEALGLVQARGGGKLAIERRGGQAAVRYLEGENAGKYAKTSLTEVSDTPEVGKYPVELWEGGTKVHFGNEIVDVISAEKPATSSAIRSKSAPDATTASATTRPAKESTVTPDFDLARKVRQEAGTKEVFPVTDAFLKEREQLDKSKTTHTQPSLLPEGAARATTTTVDSGVRRALEHVERLHKLGRPMSASMQEFLKGAGVDVEEFQRQLRGEIKPVAEKNSQPLPTPRVQSENAATALETPRTAGKVPATLLPEINNLRSQFRAGKIKPGEVIELSNGVKVKAPSKDSQFLDIVGRKLTEEGEAYGRSAQRIRAYWANKTGEGEQAVRSILDTFNLPGDPHTGEAQDLAHRAIIKMYDNPRMAPETIGRLVQEEAKAGQKLEKTGSSLAQIPASDLYARLKTKGLEVALPPDLRQIGKEVAQGRRGQISLYNRRLKEASEEASASTQRAITTGSYKKITEDIKRVAPGAKSVLDYGAGLGLGTDALREGLPSHKVDAFEPFPGKWKGKTAPTYTDSGDINTKYDVVTSANVLNVLRRPLRDEVVKDIYDKIAPGGTGIIITRGWNGDISPQKGALGAEPKSKITSDGVYQKGWDGNELVEYLKEVVPGAKIEKYTGAGKNGAIIRKPEEGRALYNRKAGQKDEAGFYSQLEKTIDQKFGKTVSLPEMERALRNSKEVKADELKWSGFDDFLVGKQMQGISKVPKEEVLRYLQANSAKLKVKEKGVNAKLSPEMEERITSLKKESDELKSVIDSLAEAKEKLKKEYRKIKFLEGMEDRKIEMREKIDSVDADLFRVFSKQDDINREVRSLSKYETTKYEDYATPGGDPDFYKEVLLTLNDPYRREESNFSSPHWDEQNVLSHARIDDRADVDGNPVRHVHEIQSDWHQAGRKEGYKKDVSKERTEYQELTKRIDAISEEIRSLQDERWSTGRKDNETGVEYLRRKSENIRKLREETDALKEKRSRITDTLYANANRPADAPLQKTWHETTFRKLVQQAAEDGKARLTWDTGETNSMRYPGAQSMNSNYKAGMHSFYDRVLPEYAKKFARKWGAKVGTTEVPVRDSDPDFDSALYDRYLEVHKTEDGKITLYDGRGADPLYFSNEQSLYKHLEKKEGIAPPDKAPQKVHFIEINDAMRESVTKEGVALYNRTPKKASDKSIEHPSDLLNGKKMIGRTGDGRVIVRNPENRSGVSVVKDRSFREVDSWDTSVPLYNRARLNPKEHIQARVAALYSDKNYEKIPLEEKNKVKRAFAEAQTAWNKGNSKEFAEKLIQAQYYEDQIIGSKRGKVDKTLDAVTTGLRVGILTNPASRVADVTGTNLNAQMQFGINPLRRLIAHVADATLAKSAAKKVSADAGVKFNINPNEKLSKVVPKLKGKDWMSGTANGFTEGAKEFAEQLFKGYSTLQMESGMSYNVDRLQTGWKYVDKPINRVAAIFGNAPDSFARGIVFDTVSRQLARQHAEQFPEAQQKAEFDKFYQDMPQEAIGLAVAMTERYTYNNPNRASELVHSVIDGFVAKPLQPGARALANSTFKFVKVPTNVAAQGMRLAAGPAMLAYDVGMLYHSLLQSYNTSTGKFDMTAAERRRSIDNLTESAVGSMLFAGLAVGTMIAKDNAYNQAIKKNVAGSYDESDTEATKMEEVREMEPGAVTVKGRTFRPGTFGPLQRTAQFQKDFLRGTGYQGLDQKTGKLKEAGASDIYAPKTGSLSKAVISQMEQFPLVGGAVETAKFLDPAKGDMAKSVANTITPGIAREIGSYTDENRRVPRKGSLWDNLKNNFGAGNDMPARINAAGEPVTKRSGASIWTKKYPESKGLDEVERLGLSLPRHNVSEKDSKYTMKEQEGKAVFLGQTIKAATDKVVTSTAYQKAKSDEEKAQMLNDVIQGINKSPDLTADEALHNAKIAVSYYSGREKLRNNATFQKLAPSQREAAENYLKAQYNKYAVTNELKVDGEKPDLMSLGADFFDFASDKAALSDLIQESVFRSAEKPKLPFERKKK